jgi:outer membrane protein assembly factor BamB
VNRRHILIGLALLAVCGLSGAISGWLTYEATSTREVRGSAADEFVPTANPADHRAIPKPRAARPQPKPKAKVKPAVPKPRKRVKPGRLDGVEWWPTYGFDNARTHVSLPYDLKPPFRRDWMFRAAHYLEFPPAVAYGRIYVPQQRGRFFAVNAATGKIVWERKFRRCLAASPVVHDGVVYQAVMHGLPCPKWNRGARGFVIAMDARTGKTIWRFDAGVVESSPLLHDGRLYFGSWDHHLYSVRAKDGKLLWSYLADDELNSAPAYAGGTIYIGSDGGRLHAVNALSGRARWIASAFSRFGRREYFYATPTIAYGRVFIGNTDGTMYAFGAGSGRLLWARPVGTYIYTAAAVWRRHVYVGTYDGRVYALDAATGDTRWSAGAPAAVHGAPTVLNGLVYFASCGTCGRYGSRYAKRGPFQTFALDVRTGKKVWSFADGRYSPIVADRKRVYLVGSTKLYALEPKRVVRSTAARTKARTRAQRGHSR